MTDPEDRELADYLRGDSALSRRYREAGRETPPAALDDAVLARARAALRKTPKPGPWLTGLALAASLMLAVNLGWNMYRAEPAAPQRATLKPPGAGSDAASAPPAAVPHPDIEARAEAARQERVAPAATGQAARDEARAEDRAQRRRALAEREPASAGAPAAAPAAEAAAPLTESAKIDHLIRHVANLSGAVFIRNGKEHDAAEAAGHLQLKREKAGDRVRTADDFIRLCASRSSMSGEPYLIRYADGRTRTAEEILREELARLGSR